jgi:UDP-N-acetylmuramoyl-L-alanyl-D-glutamate--2,6-diaminopimelate ligase
MKPTLPKTFPVTCHTDHVGPGSTFVAIKGMQEDGIKYVVQAIQKGATKIVVYQDAVLNDEILGLIEKNNIEFARVENPRKALAQLSAQALDYPAQKLKILGVTGTKGKTTTCFLLEHLLVHAGYKTALLSTVHNKINGTIFPTNLTTQHPDYLHVFFATCVQQGVEYVVMEVAAQAFSLNRVEGIAFDGAIFTNFDLEHAEFYATMEDYFAAKCQIFTQTKKGAPALVNIDDIHLKKLNNVISYSLYEQCANFYAHYKPDLTSTQIVLKDEYYFCHTLLGEYNAYNLLAAVSLLHSLGLPSDVLNNGLQTFAGVPGRMQLHTLPNGARGCIDNAHNPSSYKALLSTLRKLTDDLIVVFGCGGQRDATKRPIMGSIAAELCDTVLLTSDNPRTEDPAVIIEDIYEGIAKERQYKVIKELDRKVAIEKAYKLSKSTSIIAILGKGHDEYQLINGVKYPFSEKDILHHLI